MSRWFGLWLLSSTAFFFALVLFVPLTSLFSLGPLHKPHSPNSLPMTTHPHASLQGMLLPQVCLLLVGLLFIYFFCMINFFMLFKCQFKHTLPREVSMVISLKECLPISFLPPYFILTVSTTFLDRIFQSIYHYLELFYLIVYLFMNSSAMSDICIPKNHQVMWNYILLIMEL